MKSKISLAFEEEQATSKARTEFRNKLVSVANSLVRARNVSEREASDLDHAAQAKQVAALMSEAARGLADLGLTRKTLGGMAGPRPRHSKPWMSASISECRGIFLNLVDDPANTAAAEAILVASRTDLAAHHAVKDWWVSWYLGELHSAILRLKPADDWQTVLAPQSVGQDGPANGTRQGGVTRRSKPQKQRARPKAQPGWIYLNEAEDRYGVPNSSLHDWSRQLGGARTKDEDSGQVMVQVGRLEDLLRKKGRIE